MNPLRISLFTISNAAHGAMSFATILNASLA